MSQREAFPKLLGLDKQEKVCVPVVKTPHWESGFLLLVLFIHLDVARVRPL